MDLTALRELFHGHGHEGDSTIATVLDELARERAAKEEQPRRAIAAAEDLLADVDAYFAETDAWEARRGDRHWFEVERPALIRQAEIVLERAGLREPRKADVFITWEPCR